LKAVPVAVVVSVAVVVALPALAVWRVALLPRELALLGLLLLDGVLDLLLGLDGLLVSFGLGPAGLLVVEQVLDQDLDSERGPVLRVVLVQCFQLFKAIENLIEVGLALGPFIRLGIVDALL